MSRQFAMWIERAMLANVRGPQLFLGGAVLGREPELGDALVLLAPLAPPLRLHCRSHVGEPRGSAGAPFMLGIREMLDHDPRQLRGGVLVEEGVAARAFCGVLSAPRPAIRQAARFELEGDRAWGLVSVSGRTLNVVVVGGGLGNADFWDVLRSIEPEVAPAIDRVDVEPIVGPPGSSLWRLPTLLAYAREEDGYERVVVTRSAGPVEREDAKVLIDGDWCLAPVIQQREGSTQFFLYAPQDAVVVPLPRAA